MENSRHSVFPNSAQVILGSIDIAMFALQRPGDHVAFALALECHSVGREQFRLPTRQLANVGFLPGWTRQNYRTAIVNVLATWIIERSETGRLGRSGTSYRLQTGNGLANNPSRSTA